MNDFGKLFDEMGKMGITVSDEMKSRITGKIDNALNYEPRIGFFGKTGAGKSSLCNALFGKDVCLVDDVAACTRNPQEIFLNVNSKGIKLVDVPGVGERADRDKEYADLYRSLLPELDVVLWVLKADDRAFTSDELFYRNVVKPHLDQGKPLFFIINQCDKIEPFREWNLTGREPGKTQILNILKKQQYVAEFFGYPESKVIPVSAGEKYNLTRLVDEVVHALPREKKITFAAVVEKENLSPRAKEESRNGFVDFLIDVTIDPLPIPAPLKNMAKAALRSIANWGVWPWNW